jgi:hypothetical protein
MLRVKREWFVKRAGWLLAAAAVGTGLAYGPIRSLAVKQSEDFKIHYSTHTVMFILALICFAQGAEILTKRIWRRRCKKLGLPEGTPPPKRLIFAVYSIVGIIMFQVFIMGGYTPIWGA